MWQPQGIYSEYVLRSPVLLVGNSAAEELYNFPAARIAFIHGSSFKDHDFFRSIFRKKEIGFFCRSWTGEPDMEDISGTLRELENFAPDTIVAVGGGSVIDGAKLCRLFYEIPYYAPRMSAGYFLKTKFIAIPTTIGSGAEVSSAAVYVNGDRKEMIVIHELQPEIVIYDDKYVKDTPAKLLLLSAMDALSHIIEGHVSKIHNSVMDIQAAEGLRLLRIELHNFMEGKNTNYQRLQYAGYLGGVIQNHCIVGAAHAVAHQMTQFGYAHSEAVALLLPSVIKMNARNDSVREKYESIADSAGFANIDGLMDFLVSVNEVSGVNAKKPGMKNILLQKSDDKTFRNNIMLDRGGKGNPVNITDEYISELIRSF